jgi:hypothetical protein
VPLTAAPFILDPYHYHAVEKAIFQVGPKGTNDKVNVKLCSDTNDVCCETR